MNRKVGQSCANSSIRKNIIQEGKLSASKSYSGLGARAGRASVGATRGAAVAGAEAAAESALGGDSMLCAAGVVRAVGGAILSCSVKAGVIGDVSGGGGGGGSSAALGSAAWAWDARQKYCSMVFEGTPLIATSSGSGSQRATSAAAPAVRSPRCLESHSWSASV